MTSFDSCLQDGCSTGASCRGNSCVCRLPGPGAAAARAAALARSAQYTFSGNAEDGTGVKHGAIAGDPTMGADRFGMVAEAYSFDGDDFITLPTPFTDGGQHFSIAVWLSPSTIDDPSWCVASIPVSARLSTKLLTTERGFALCCFGRRHGFVGFQGDTRSPVSMHARACEWGGQGAGAGRGGACRQAGGKAAAGGGSSSREAAAGGLSYLRLLQCALAFSGLMRLVAATVPLGQLERRRQR